MSYQVEQAYGKDSREGLQKTFDRESMERSIARAKEDLGEIAMFLQAAEKQLDRIKNTPLKWFIELRKEKNYTTNHINISILPFQLPDIPDADKNSYRMYAITRYDNEKGTVSHPFLGNEKKEAVQKALEMSRKYGGCPIIGTGADMVPAQQEVIVV